MWALDTRKRGTEINMEKISHDNTQHRTKHFLWFFWTFRQQMEGNDVKLLLVFKEFLSQSLLHVPSQRST
jgi:hypothetical protein